METDEEADTVSLEAKLEAMGLSLPDAPKPVAAYVPGVKSGNLIFTSGQLPLVGGVLQYPGKVGQEISLTDGQAAARICCLNALAVVKSLLGSLEHVEQVVRVGVFVNSASGFTGQPQVANGASELLVELFGERGKHARAAVGVSELPLGAAVEVELTVQTAI